MSIKYIIETQSNSIIHYREKYQRASLYTTLRANLLCMPVREIYGQGSMIYSKRDLVIKIKEKSYKIVYIKCIIINT